MKTFALPMAVLRKSRGKPEKTLAKNIPNKRLVARMFKQPLTINKKKTIMRWEVG